MAPNPQYRKKFHSGKLLTDAVNAVTFSHDGKLVSAADSRGILLTMDVVRGAVLHVAYLAPLVQIYSLMWTTEGQLFFGCNNGVVGALALQKVGDEHYRIKVMHTLPESLPGCVGSLAYSSDVKGYPTLAVAFNHTVQLWQRSGRWRLFRTYTLDGALDHVASIAFMVNGDLLVGYQASGIRIWKTSSETTSLYLPGLDSRLINSFCLRPDGLLLVSYESSRSDHGFTNLYRLASQPPYGLTPVKNWPGRQWTHSPPSSIVALTSHGSRDLLLCSISPYEVAVVEARGLPEQFTPALPEAAECDVVVHSEDCVIQALAVSATETHNYVAAAHTAGGLTRVDVWTTDANLTTHPETIIHQENLSELIWGHAIKDQWTFWGVTYWIFFWSLIGVMAALLAMCVCLICFDPIRCDDWLGVTIVREYGELLLGFIGSQARPHLPASFLRWACQEHEPEPTSFINRVCYI